MLLFSISAFLALGLTSVVKGYADYEDITDEDTYEDYEESYNDGDETSQTSIYEDSTVNRVRRYELHSAIKTLGPEEVREVRGALKQLLSGIAVENPFTPFTTTTYNYRSTYPSTTSTQTYETTLTANTTESTISSTYFSKLSTEIFQFINSEPTRSKNTVRFLLRKRDTTTVTTPTPTTTIIKTTTKIPPVPIFPDRKRPDLDIPKLLALISVLAQEFETNLTRKLNESLITLTLPNCTTPTTEAPITSPYEGKYVGSVISKCFVCGLDIPEIPRHAHCADAFAGDFLPLVPVDPTAKGKISRFKKYCKFSNIPGFHFNDSDPRVLSGRWTGGCSVRWIDLSGIYTQRTCRNRIQPTMGRHFASKRMAKLERTLWNVDNGCITSPMATLVPLSRGVSLYARFHACVCTGSWCNYTGLTTPCIKFIVTVSLLNLITNLVCIIN